MPTITFPIIKAYLATSICTERDVIYALTCTECDKVVYVGETGRQHSELLGQFRESDLGCMLGVVLCTKKLHSIRRKNIVLKHDSQSH